MNDEFNQLLQKTGEYGVVYQINYPIVFIEGLPKGRTHEVVLFESGQKGEIFSINRGKIEVRLFDQDPVVVGTRVARTDKLLSVPVGQELLGQVINPLGEPLEPSPNFVVPKEVRNLDTEPMGIAGRQKLATQMITGVALIDLLLPLGKGQRELIIGDRKTGKTAILLTTMKNQIFEGVVVIYAAIAKKKSDIKKLQEFCVKEKIMNRMVIVATPSYSSSSLIYQTPYAAMTIAEYFRDQGVNTLVIFDDLSAHAKCYREISLLAKRFPGRGSYPGDIFYIHSSLLERAGNYKHPKVKEVSITCLPVMETVEGDLASYVTTNVMGITDGHIYVDSNIYLQGIRPAVNVPVSVTRVGRQTLDKLSRDWNSYLTAFLAEYAKLQTVSHFGQELSEEVKEKLKMGDVINAFFNQSYHIIIPKPVQLITISLITQKIITDTKQLDTLKQALLTAYYDRGNQKLLHEIMETRDMKQFNENVMKNKDRLLALAGIQSTSAQPTSQPPAQPNAQNPQAVPQNSQTPQTTTQTAQPPAQNSQPTAS